MTSSPPESARTAIRRHGFQLESPGTPYGAPSRRRRGMYARDPVVQIHTTAAGDAVHAVVEQCMDLMYLRVGTWRSTYAMPPVARPPRDGTPQARPTCREGPEPAPLYRACACWRRRGPEVVEHLHDGYRARAWGHSPRRPRCRSCRDHATVLVRGDGGFPANVDTR